RPPNVGGAATAVADASAAPRIIPMHAIAFALATMASFPLRPPEQAKRNDSRRRWSIDHRASCVPFARSLFLFPQSRPPRRVPPARRLPDPVPARLSAQARHGVCVASLHTGQRQAVRAEARTGRPVCCILAQVMGRKAAGP